MADKENERGSLAGLGGETTPSTCIPIPPSRGMRAVRTRKRRSTAPGGQPSPREEQSATLPVGSFRSADAASKMADILAAHRAGTLFSERQEPQQPDPATKPTGPTN